MRPPRRRRSSAIARIPAQNRHEQGRQGRQARKPAPDWIQNPPPELRELARAVGRAVRIFAEKYLGPLPLEAADWPCLCGGPAGGPHVAPCPRFYLHGR
jgi:hypothetical protein